VANLLKATRVSKIYISKVQARKLPKAATSTLQLVQSPKGKFQFPTFSIFPDFSLTTLEIPRLFQVFQVSGHPVDGCKLVREDFTRYVTVRQNY